MKKHHLGFIDPVSLITLGILIVGLVVSTAIVKNPNISLDIRQWARVIEDSEITTKKAATKETPTRTAKPAAPNSLEKIREIEIAEEEKAAPAVQPPAQPVAITTKPDLEPEETPSQTRINTGRCPNGALAPDGDTSQCPTPAQTTPAPPKEPYCSRSCSGNSYCEPDVTGGRCVIDLPPRPIATTKPSIPTMPTTITKSDYQECLDKGNTPSECSPIAQNIGKTITTPVDKTECTAEEKFCSGGNLKVCSNSGTWGLTTCQYGCENGACKPKPVTIPAAPAIPESVYYTPDALPPQITAVNPPNDPLSLTQDPMMAATLNQKIQDCLNKGFTQNQCTQAFQEAANTKDTCVAFYMLDNPNADVQQTADKCTQERANAAMMAAMVVPGAMPILQSAGTAYYTGAAIDQCTAYNQVKDDPTVDQEAKRALLQGCYVNSVAAVTSLGGIAGSAIAPSLSTAGPGTQALVAGLTAVDAAGNLAASTLSTYQTYQQYGSNSPEFLTAAAYNLIALNSFGQNAYGAYASGTQ